MTLYSFKGHYPVEQVDSSEGWYEVPAKPEAPKGKEIAWLNAEWVVRDPKPEDRPGYQWNWNHDARDWVECRYAIIPQENVESPVIAESNSSAVTSSGVAIAVDGVPT